MSILEMSFAASVLIVATVIVRTIGLYRLPKKVFLCLWGIATLRLLVPFSIPLSFIIPEGWVVPASGIAASPDPYTLPETIVSPNGSTTPIPVVLIIWLTGICACALFFAISYFKSCKEFKTSLPVESEFIDQWLREHHLQRSVQIRQTDRTRVPLTYGIFHPVILLPKSMGLTDETNLCYVLAHEYAHIQHFDALTKLVLAVAVSCHWFNPLVWVMYILANRDIELTCDETVVKSLGKDGKSAYVLTLIRLEEIKSRTAIVNYFSKNFVEERMTAIMKTKKYTLPVMIITFMLVFGSTIVFATPAAAAGKHLSGHSVDDGRDYHAVCNVEGCTEVTEHEHDGMYYSGHSVGDGHDYHAVCNVEGCTEMTEHQHEYPSATSSNRGNGHHNSGHGRRGHH